LLHLVERRWADRPRAEQLDHMPAVLRLYRLRRVLPDLQVADCIGKGLHHVIQGEPAEVAAIRLRGVHRLRLREIFEFLAFLQAVDDLLRERLRRDEDVPRVVLRLWQLLYLGGVFSLHFFVSDTAATEK